MPVVYNACHTGAFWVTIACQGFSSETPKLTDIAVDEHCNQAIESTCSTSGDGKISQETSITSNVGNRGAEPTKVTTITPHDESPKASKRTVIVSNGHCTESEIMTIASNDNTTEGLLETSKSSKGTSCITSCGHSPWVSRITTITSNDYSDETSGVMSITCTEYTTEPPQITDNTCDTKSTSTTSDNSEVSKETDSTRDDHPDEVSQVMTITCNEHSVEPSQVTDVTLTDHSTDHEESQETSITSNEYHSDSSQETNVIRKHHSAEVAQAMRVTFSDKIDVTEAAQWDRKTSRPWKRYKDCKNVSR